MFARFGVRVTVVEAPDRLLAMEEPESSALAASVLAAEGVEIRTGAAVERVEHRDDGFVVTLAGARTLDGRAAAGRHRPPDGPGRARPRRRSGSTRRARFIEVDERMRAGDRLWAVGDVTGHGAFTHMAMYQAGIAVRDILGQGGPPADYRALPRVTFTDPEIGAVGLTERQARDAGLNVRIGHTDVASPPGAGSTRRATRASSSWWPTPTPGVLVGGDVGRAGRRRGPVGPRGRGARRVPLDPLRHMIYAYPTFHRAISEALAALD